MWTISRSTLKLLSAFLTGMGVVLMFVSITNTSRNAMLSPVDQKFLTNDDTLYDYEQTDLDEQEETFYDPNNALSLYDVEDKVKFLDQIENHLADVSEPRVDTDIMVFWHVIRSGGTTVKTIGSKCLDLVMITEEGIGHEETELEVLVKPTGSFVNVDTSTVDGLKRAYDLGLGSSALGDMLVSPHVLEVSTVLTESRRGRMFCLLRHPVLRAASIYHHMEKTGKTVWEMTLEEFSAMDSTIPNNHMTRLLSKSGNAKLTKKDLATAKEMLRRKFLIGLLDDVRESFSRFNKYFSWKVDTLDKIMCLKSYVHWDWPSQQEYQVPVEGTKTWDALAEINEFDVQLYQYATRLFVEQKALFL